MLFCNEFVHVELSFPQTNFEETHAKNKPAPSNQEEEVTRDSVRTSNQAEKTPEVPNKIDKERKSDVQILMEEIVIDSGTADHKNKYTCGYNKKVILNTAMKHQSKISGKPTRMETKTKTDPSAFTMQDKQKVKIEPCKKHSAKDENEIEGKGNKRKENCPSTNEVNGPKFGAEKSRKNWDRSQKINEQNKIARSSPHEKANGAGLKAAEAQQNKSQKRDTEKNRNEK